MEAVSDILRFTIYDYGVSIILLAVSALIGVYYGFVTKQKQNSPDEYLLGSKAIGLLPISISLIVWQISGMTLLGLPVEVYTNGTQQWASIISVIGVGLALNYIYLPVFYDLQCTSCFTYLELRFSRQVQKLASLLFTISMLLFIPTVIYIPALAFNQVSGINLNIITTITCLVCIFYTTVGGLKAVVWTDALQFFMMLAAVLSIIIVGSKDVGGFWDIWNAAERGHRLIIFNPDPSPFERLSFWSVTVGLTFQMTANICISPTVVQRCVSLENYSKVKKNFVGQPCNNQLSHEQATNQTTLDAATSIFVFMFGIILFNVCGHITGLQMYTKYEKCDPFVAGITQKIDQVLPYFVMDVGGSIPGLPGLFIAGIFAAALSTMSSSLNTLSGTIYEDFFKEHLPMVSTVKASNIMKRIVLCLGITMLILVYFVGKLGQVYELSVGLSSITTGTMLGIFTMGMISRSTNNKGVVTGALVSVFVVGLAMIGAETIKKETMLPMRSDGCNSSQIIASNSTKIINELTEDVSDHFWLFRISFMYYAVIGFVLVFLVGYPVSRLTGRAKHFNEVLLMPCKRRTTEYQQL